MAQRREGEAGPGTEWPTEAFWPVSEGLPGFVWGGWGKERRPVQRTLTGALSSRQALAPREAHEVPASSSPHLSPPKELPKELKKMLRDKEPAAPQGSTSLRNGSQPEG